MLFPLQPLLFLASVSSFLAAHAQPLQHQHDTRGPPVWKVGAPADNSVNPPPSPDTPDWKRSPVEFEDMPDWKVAKPRGVTGPDWKVGKLTPPKRLLAAHSPATVPPVIDALTATLTKTPTTAFPTTSTSSSDTASCPPSACPTCIPGWSFTYLPPVTGTCSLCTCVTDTTYTTSAFANYR